MYSPLRRLVQLLVFSGLVIIPFISIYERILFTVSYPLYGKIGTEAEGIKTQLADRLVNSHFMPIIIKLDKIFSSLVPDYNQVITILEGFKGAPWTITIGGVTISDPLAVLSVIFSSKELNIHLLTTIIIPIIMALLLGRVFCGWLCPIRPILELAAFLRKQLIKLGVKLPTLEIPSYVSYLILLFGLVSAIGGVLIFPFLLPYAIMSRTISLWIFGLTISPAVMVLMLLIIFEATFMSSQWCNSLCPTGTVLGLLGRKRLLSIKANKGSCLSNLGCNQCEKACFMNIHPAIEDQGRMKSQCTSCGACIDACKTKSLGFGINPPRIDLSNPKYHLTILKK